jgi:hypothetical protein
LSLRHARVILGAPFRVHTAGVAAEEVRVRL